MLLLLMEWLPLFLLQNEFSYPRGLGNVSVPVRTDHWGSVIAYTLSSELYYKQLIKCIADATERYVFEFVACSSLHDDGVRYEASTATAAAAGDTGVEAAGGEAKEGNGAEKPTPNGRASSDPELKAPPAAKLKAQTSLPPLDRRESREDFNLSRRLSATQDGGLAPSINTQYSGELPASGVLPASENGYFIPVQVAIETGSKGVEADANALERLISRVENNSAVPEGEEDWSTLAMQKQGNKRWNLLRGKNSSNTTTIDLAAYPSDNGFQYIGATVVSMVPAHSTKVSKSKPAKRKRLQGQELPAHPPRPKAPVKPQTASMAEGVEQTDGSEVDTEKEQSKRQVSSDHGSDRSHERSDRTGGAASNDDTSDQTPLSPAAVLRRSNTAGFRRTKHRRSAGTVQETDILATTVKERRRRGRAGTSGNSREAKGKPLAVPPPHHRRHHHRQRSNSANLSVWVSGRGKKELESDSEAEKSEDNAANDRVKDVEGYQIPGSDDGESGTGGRNGSPVSRRKRLEEASLARVDSLLQSAWSTKPMAGSHLGFHMPLPISSTSMELTDVLRRLSVQRGSKGWGKGGRRRQWATLPLKSHSSKAEPPASTSQLPLADTNGRGPLPAVKEHHDDTVSGEADAPRQSMHRSYLTVSGVKGLGSAVERFHATAGDSDGSGTPNSSRSRLEELFGDVGALPPSTRLKDPPSSFKESSGPASPASSTTSSTSSTSDSSSQEVIVEEVHGADGKVEETKIDEVAGNPEKSSGAAEPGSSSSTASTASHCSLRPRRRTRRNNARGWWFDVHFQLLLQALHASTLCTSLQYFYYGSALSDMFKISMPLTPAQVLLSDVESDIMLRLPPLRTPKGASYRLLVYLPWALHFHALREICCISQRR